MKVPPLSLEKYKYSGIKPEFLFDPSIMLWNSSKYFSKSVEKAEEERQPTKQDSEDQRMTMNLFSDLHLPIFTIYIVYINNYSFVQIGGPM